MQADLEAHRKGGQLRWSEGSVQVPYLDGTAARPESNLNQMNL